MCGTPQHVPTRTGSQSHLALVDERSSIGGKVDHRLHLDLPHSLVDVLHLLRYPGGGGHGVHTAGGVLNFWSAQKARAGGCSAPALLYPCPFPALCNTAELGRGRSLRLCDAVILLSDLALLVFGSLQLSPPGTMRGGHAPHIHTDEQPTTASSPTATCGELESARAAPYERRYCDTGRRWQRLDGRSLVTLILTARGERLD